MRKTFLALAIALMNALVALAAEYTDVSMKVSGMTTTMNNGKLSVTIGSNGRVSSMKMNMTRELLGSNGIYFDYTTSEGNKGLSPAKVEVIKNTSDICEVLYSATDGNTIFQQGFVMRKNTTGLYTYVIATGTATSANEPIKEARVCARLAPDLLNGYVDYRMNGKIPTNDEMLEAEKNQIQDATYYLTDGSIYTKYNWANYIERDTLHGLYTSSNYGLWNIPVSYEWLNGGPERQELMVHATSKSPISIQMLQGEHFGGKAMVLNDGEKKLYGPFLIYANYASNPVTNARQRANSERVMWPYQWFDNELYPKIRGTVKGHINVLTGQRNDNIRVVLAQEEDVDPMKQVHGYQFWATTNADGDFEIKKVRPGKYTLYAYAQAGDVTDMLQVKNFTVAEGEQTLGNIDWTPTKYDNFLWMIGQNNRRSDEFHYSDVVRQYGLWKNVPENLTYVIGKSNPKTDWYYAQCRQGTWTIEFDLDKKYSDNAVLTASLAGCTGTGTTVEVSVNGSSSKATWKPGINDAGIYRSAVNSGFHHLMTCTFPASLLKVGTNNIRLKMSGNGSNGGFMYDCIKLEAGGIVTDVDGVKEHVAPAVKRNVKKWKNGRLVIETSGGDVNILGQMQ